MDAQKLNCSLNEECKNNCLCVHVGSYGTCQSLLCRPSSSAAYLGCSSAELIDLNNYFFNA